MEKSKIMTIEERLNESISEKESEIEALNEKIEKLEFDADLSSLSWMVHKGYENDEFNQQMPFPRLEMKITKEWDNWSAINYTYGLVYRHYSDHSGKSLLFIPFGRTSSRGGFGDFENWFREGKLSTPFRDGMHIQSEAFMLGLPMYITCKEMNICQKLELDPDVISRFNKMKSTSEDRILNE